MWFEIANWQILPMIYRIICSRHNNGGVLSFHIFILVLTNNLGNPNAVHFVSYSNVMHDTWVTEDVSALNNSIFYL